MVEVHPERAGLGATHGVHDREVRLDDVALAGQIGERGADGRRVAAGRRRGVGRAGTRDRGYVCVAATHTVVACQDDHELASAVAGASLVVPDGQPVVWAMNAFGAGLRGRVYGPELMARHMARSTTTGARHYLYGGRNEGALVQLTLNLRRRFDGVKIVGGALRWQVAVNDGVALS